MPVSRITAFLPCDVEAVWAVVTDLSDTGWRSDLLATEMLPDGRFVERARGGVATVFTVTACEPCGRWTGLFEPERGGVRLTFTERVTLRRRWLAPLAVLYLRWQQRTYLEDLRRRLTETGVLAQPQEENRPACARRPAARGR